MNNPDITRPGEWEYYQPCKPGGLRQDYNRRTHDQLVQDVKVAHNFIKQLVREKNWLHDRMAQLAHRNDLLQVALRNQATQIKHDKRSRELLWATWAFTWFAFAAVLKWMVPYVVTGLVNGTR